MRQFRMARARNPIYTPTDVFFLFHYSQHTILVKLPKHTVCCHLPIIILPAVFLDRLDLSQRNSKKQERQPLQYRLGAAISFLPKSSKQHLQVWRPLGVQSSTPPSWRDLTSTSSLSSDLFWDQSSGSFVEATSSLHNWIFSIQTPLIVLGLGFRLTTLGLSLRGRRDSRASWRPYFNICASHGGGALEAVRCVAGNAESCTLNTKPN